MKLIVTFSRKAGRNPIIAQVVRDTGVLINVERALIDSSEGEAMIAIHALGERDRALPLCLASLTAALVLLFGPPSALALSPSPTPSATPTTWATLTSTGTPATTPTATGTAWLTPTATSTFELTLINLEMPAHIFSEGDACSLVLNIINLGNERKVDLYVLLDVFGDYYCYPSWCHYQEEGLDWGTAVNGRSFFHFNRDALYKTAKDKYG